MDDATARRIDELAKRLRETYAELAVASARRRVTKSGYGPSDPRLVEAELLADVAMWIGHLRPLLDAHGLVMMTVSDPGPPVVVERYVLTPVRGDLVSGVFIGTHWSYGKGVRVEVAATDEIRARLLELGAERAVVVGGLAQDGRTLERAF